MTFPISKILLFCYFLTVVSGPIFGKGFLLIHSEQDTIVKMSGHVYDTLFDPQERLVLKARIILQSIPHGNEIGIITSNDQGYYEFYANMSTTYNVSVESENHRKHTLVFDPNKVISGDQITLDFYLEPELKENQVIRLEKLIFEQSKAAITTASYQELNRLVSIMHENPGMQIQLEGHTDYRGNKKMNMELSRQRVDAVKSYLVSKNIQPGRIKTKAYGSTKPLVREQSIEASEINRRVEVRILKL